MDNLEERILCSLSILEKSIGDRELVKIKLRNLEDYLKLKPAVVYIAPVPTIQVFYIQQTFTYKMPETHHEEFKKKIKIVDILFEMPTKLDGK